MKVYYKSAYVFVLFLLVSLLVSCTTTQLPEETYEQKPITGIDPIFEESLGYTNQYPSAIRLNNQLQYVYYSKNVTKYSMEESVIVVREAVNQNDTWNYKQPKIVLEPSLDGWDKHVFSADVIKGEFQYNGEQYSYLMAYAGSELSNQLNAQIGLAVSKSPTEKFIKVGNSPLISFDKTTQSTSGI